jgi:hypothetical protein
MRPPLEDLSPDSLAALLGVTIDTLQAVAVAAYPLSLPTDALQMTRLQLVALIGQAAGDGSIAEALRRLYAAPQREHLFARLAERGWRPAV